MFHPSLRPHKEATGEENTDVCTPYVLTSRAGSLRQASGVALVVHASPQPPGHSKQRHLPRTADQYHSPISTGEYLLCLHCVTGKRVHCQEKDKDIGDDDEIGLQSVANRASR
ncbi:hypothetical protein O3P69_003838 [Scylla paramamosain]|uniref:Uncharacterized protein n=1 Tax=Scylla paramamosain TaxID=85552 RepID=A0AAW0UFK4_SCYPA